MKAITGQSEDVMIFLNQPSSFNAARATGSHVKMYEVARDYPEKFRVICPNYNILWGNNARPDDFTHPNGTGYAYIGELFGEAFIAEFIKGSMWRGLRPTSVNEVSNTVIDIFFTVQNDPMTIDTTSFPDPRSDAFSLFGFEVIDGDGAFLPIQTAQVVSGDRVRLTLGAAIDGNPGTRKVRYGLLPGQDVIEIQGNIPRGNLRDTTNNIALFDAKTPLWNWCVHFEETF